LTQRQSRRQWCPNSLEYMHFDYARSIFSAAGLTGRVGNPVGTAACLKCQRLALTFFLHKTKNN
jgi:hypothetical protein